MNNVRVITEDPMEWLTLEEAQLYLRLDTYGSPPEHPDDDLIHRLIAAARERCEEFTGLSLRPKLLELPLNTFPCYSASGYAWHENSGIVLPYGPVQSIVSVTYPGDDATENFVTDYQLDDFVQPAKLYPAAGGSWPTSTWSGSRNAVRIRYHAGYNNPADSPSPVPLPKQIEQGMLLCISFWYENRGEENVVKKLDIPWAAEMCWRGSRVEMSFA